MIAAFLAHPIVCMIIVYIISVSISDILTSLFENFGDKKRGKLDE